MNFGATTGPLDGPAMLAGAVAKLINDYGVIAGALILLVALGAVLKKAWPAISQFVTVTNIMASLPNTLQDIKDEQTDAKTAASDGLQELAARMETMEKRFETVEAVTSIIKKQVLPNGGSSLNDKVVGIAESVDKVEKRLDSHISNTERQRGPDNVWG